MFKFADAGLDIVEGVVRKTGGTEEGFVFSTIKKLRSTFGYLGFKKSDAIVTEEVCVDEVAKDIITDEAVADVVTDEEDLNEMEEEVNECHTPACDKVVHRLCHTK